MLIKIVAYFGVYMCLTTVAVGAVHCGNSEPRIVCNGVKIVKSLMRQISEMDSIKLLPGVEIVQNEKQDYLATNEVDTFDMKGKDYGLLGQIGRFLKSHDVKINLSEIVKKDDVEEIYRSVVNLVQNQDVAGERCSFIVA
jgi:hypothetical protein